VAYNHGGNYFFDADNGKGQLTPALDKQKTMNIVNASLAWTSSSGRYDVTAWGKNITGNKYISFGFEEALLTQFGPAPPATYGVTLGVHFK
jgi:outer membrane receptor protein involved in Fe transport